MIVLHIAKIWNNGCCGVDVVVPKHVEAQSSICKCSLYNVANVELKFDANQLYLTGDFDVKKFDPPFDKPDIVVFHEIYHQEYIKIYKNLLKSKIPYIVVPHSQLTKDAQKRKRFKKIVANLLLFNTFLRHSVGIHFLSEFESKTSKKFSNSFVVPNGMDDKKNEKTFHTDSISFKYIGRLEAYQKGLDILIEAIAMNHSSFIDYRARLDIYGPDFNGRLSRLKALVLKFNVSDIVYLHHEIKGIDKENALLDTDYFIQTSRFEGMPMGILEALSYGVPCLVTEGTTLSQTIEHYRAGFSSTNDVWAVAEMIKNALENGKKTFSQQSENAHKLIEELFGWNNIAKSCLLNYQKMIEK